jgi:hypothetical protein
MKPPKARQKCLHCQGLFLPDCRTGHHQRYCLKPECRKARKRELMKAWLAKPENQNYFRGADNAERARKWQEAHPGYWKNTARYRRRTLQDGATQQVPPAQEVTPKPPNRTLQDLCAMQVPLWVGFMSMFMGSTLPDDIANNLRQLLIKGHDILGVVPGVNHERLLHEKTSPQSGASSESPPAIQLD